MDKTEMAQARTDWAEDRTILALERTYAGWLGMGLGAVAVALGLRAVFAAAEPTWIAKAVASAFLAVALGTFFAARQQACRSYERLHANDTEAQTPRVFTLISAGLALATLATGGVLWSL
ncbi:MAG: DUF202 domain-containing protein [Shimia sp.]